MTTKLTEVDRHHWTPVPQIVHWLCEQIPTGARVLEIGPGNGQVFPRADTFVDWCEVPYVPNDKLHICDLASEPLPFADKSFDFIYARHVLEDMYNPFLLCREMSRVGKAGYIETPSPIVELCRGVDGKSPAWRGYHHHRFMVWEYKGELRFVSKYPQVEYLRFDDEQLVSLARSGPKYWNTSYLWADQMNVVHCQNGMHFDMGRGEYQLLLENALHAARASIDEFWLRVPQVIQVPQLLAQVGANAAA